MNRDKNKTLSIEKYLNKNTPYLKDIRNDAKNPDAWKNQITMAIDLMSYKETDEESAMHSKSERSYRRTFSITSF